MEQRGIPASPHDADNLVQILHHPFCCQLKLFHENLPAQWQEAGIIIPAYGLRFIPAYGLSSLGHLQTKRAFPSAPPAKIHLSPDWQGDVPRGELTLFVDKKNGK